MIHINQHSPQFWYYFCLLKKSFHAYLFALPPLVNKYMDRYNWYGRELVWSQANDCKVYSSTLEI